MSTEEGRARHYRILPQGRRLRLLAGTLLLMGFGLSAHSAHAQTIYNFTVNTTADTHDATPGDGKCDDAAGNCSMRAGVEEANALPHPAGTQTIVNIQIPGGTYVLTLGELQLQNNTITLNGGTISGNNASRVFYIGPNTLATLQNMTITAGNGRGSPGVNGQGGGIYSNGSLTLFNDVVSNNTASMIGVSGYCFGNTNRAAGGGLYETGSFPLTIQTSTFSGNTARATGSSGSACGGAIFTFSASTTIRSSTFTGNTVSGGASVYGGAIDNDGTAQISYSTVSNNQAVVTAAGLNRSATGGGMHNQNTWQLVQITVTNNQAIDTHASGGARGGGIDNDGSMSLTGPGKITNNLASGALFASGGGLENDDFTYMTGGVTISQNTAMTNSVGITTRTCGSVLRVSACTQGGGVSNYDFVDMHETYITFNKALANVCPAPPAACTGTAVAVSEGGGLENDPRANGVTAQYVNIAGNSVSATASTASRQFAQGGGEWNAEPLNLQNSFVQRNSSAQDGGGIYDDVSGSSAGNGSYVSLNASRVTQNTAGHEGGGIFNFYPVSQTNSQIAFNSAPICPNIVVPCQ